VSSFLAAHQHKKGYLVPFKVYTMNESGQRWTWGGGQNAGFRGRLLSMTLCLSEMLKHQG